MEKINFWLNANGNARDATTTGDTDQGSDTDDADTDTAADQAYTITGLNLQVDKNSDFGSGSDKDKKLDNFGSGSDKDDFYSSNDTSAGSGGLTDFRYGNAGTGDVDVDDIGGSSSAEAGAQNTE